MSEKTIASDVAFTARVKAEQVKRGSRAAYARMEQGEGWSTTVTAELREFLGERDSFYFGTANAAGQPYIQHRGGPPGLIQVVNERTLGFVDYPGNRQFITLGNLAENDQAFLFLMDYERQRRVKVWGRARVVDGDAALIAALTPAGSKSRGERAILFTIEAWDVNCPQHIPQKLDARAVRARIDQLESTLRDLEAENARLQSQCADRARQARSVR